jgi:hypothetical protein
MLVMARENTLGTLLDSESIVPNPTGDNFAFYVSRKRKLLHYRALLTLIDAMRKADFLCQPLKVLFPVITSWGEFDKGFKTFFETVSLKFGASLCFSGKRKTVAVAAFRQRFYGRSGLFQGISLAMRGQGRESRD